MLQNKTQIMPPLSTNSVKNSNVQNSLESLKKLKRNLHSRLVRDKHNKVKHDEPQVRTKGCVNPDSIAKHKSKTNTGPEYYVEIVILLKIITRGKKDMFIFEIITRWYNLKAKISISGKRSNIIPVFCSIYSQHMLPTFWPLHLL